MELYPLIQDLCQVCMELIPLIQDLCQDNFTAANS
jgi:hypothetical protein